MVLCGGIGASNLSRQNFNSCEIINLGSVSGFNRETALLGLLAEEFLGLGVVDQDLCQVLLVQDEQVGEAMCLHIGCASVASTPCK